MALMKRLEVLLPGLDVAVAGVADEEEGRWRLEALRLGELGDLCVESGIVVVVAAKEGVLTETGVAAASLEGVGLDLLLLPTEGLLSLSHMRPKKDFDADFGVDAISSSSPSSSRDPCW